ncbi:MAG: type II secretion system F family protein [Pseudomonadota bacterium]
MDQDLLIYGVAGLAFLAIAGVGMAFAGGGTGEAASKRAKQISAGRKDASGKAKRDKQDARRRQTQQMLEQLRDQNEAKKRSIMPRDIGSRLQQAGLDIPVSYFWVVSAVLGVALATLAFLSGADGFTVSGIELRSQIAVVFAAGFAGFFGLPRFILGFLAKGRNKKLTNQFADAIDIIVRGVKSGLPLNECLQIIARESPEPLSSEFQKLADNIRMGNTIEQALSKFYQRVPLPEVNFFVIVLNIQSKSGGNLSEALGNLSSIIRSRKMMREKIKAMSSEAKASAMIIGSLPFAVGGMVYMTTPDYVMELFTTPTGHTFLAAGGFWMFLGIMVMRNMINFEI